MKLLSYGCISFELFSLLLRHIHVSPFFRQVFCCLLMIMETRTNMSSVTWLTSINYWSTLLTRCLMMRSTKEQRYVYLSLIKMMMMITIIMIIIIIIIIYHYYHCYCYNKNLVNRNRENVEHENNNNTSGQRCSWPCQESDGKVHKQNPGEHQKIVLLGTAHILRRILCIK